MEAKTYELAADPADCSEYLSDVSQLVGELRTKGELLRPLTESYGEFAAQTLGADKRSHEEYLVELLLLGVLWRSRGPESQKQTRAQRDLVTELIYERRSGMGKRRDGTSAALLDLSHPLEWGTLTPTLSSLQQLFEHLYATGEYDDEVARVNGWLAYFSQLSNNIATTIQLIVAIASDFEVRSKICLGRYTAGVNRFLIEELPNYAGREDVAQCSRRRLEYHVSMVGAELLNRVWQAEFLACETRIVVIPGCARANTDKNCKAHRTDMELHCTHCQKSCIISAAQRLASRYDVPVVSVLHGSDFSQFLRAASARGGRVGVVGVACAPGILGAGFRAKDLGLPAQCVLLNRSGCSHWTQDPRSTSFDLSELERIISGKTREEVKFPNAAQAPIPPRLYRPKGGLSEGCDVALPGL